MGDSETAMVIDDSEVAAALAASIVHDDLRFSTEVTPAAAAEFEHPQSVVTRLRVDLARLFEGEL